MSQINEAESSKLARLCKDAKVVDARRCSPVLCGSDNPDAGIAPQIPLPLLNKGDVCVATTFYSTGHVDPDCDVDIEKIKTCPYRRY
jgi:hypothetical protein